MTAVTPEHEHFGQAARRHRDDALHLHQSGRLPNADHLLGLGVECIIKSVLLDLSYAVAFNGAVPVLQNHPTPGTTTRLQAHISSLATTISTFARGHGSIQFVAAVDAASVVYTTWDISDRYRDGAHISEADFQGRRTAADAVYRAAQDSKLKQVLT